MNAVKMHPLTLRDLLEVQEKLNNPSREPTYVWVPEDSRRWWNEDSHNRKIMAIVHSLMRSRGWVK